VSDGGAHTNLESKQAIELAITNGKGGLFLQLSPDQYAKLERGRDEAAETRQYNRRMKELAAEDAAKRGGLPARLMTATR
jgi:hypothetical protein